jgi:hypothetical protein
MRGLPVNVKALRVSCAPLHELEQAVARTNVPAATGLNNDGRPPGSTTQKKTVFAGNQEA